MRSREVTGICQGNNSELPNQALPCSETTAMVTPSAEIFHRERRIRRRSIDFPYSLLLLASVSLFGLARNSYHCCSALSIASAVRGIIPSSLFSSPSHSWSSKQQSTELKHQEAFTISKSGTGGNIDESRSVTTRISLQRRRQNQQKLTDNRLFVPSSLFATPYQHSNTITSTRHNVSRRHQRHLRKNLFQTRQQHYTSSKSTTSSASSESPTALHMVLTTPESIIEQASTMKLLDDLIDESVRTTARRPFILQFDPSSGYLWRQWKGTIFSVTWKSALRNMIYALLMYYFYDSISPQIKSNLSGLSTLWGQLLSVTTFTLTFFVNQSYALWRKCIELSRRIQGRLHDIGLNLATHAARKSPSNPNEPAQYTAASRQVLELMSRYIRLFNLLTYASFTRSHRPILTPRGMRRLVERGLMTSQERQVLVDASIPATQRHSAILMWMMRLYYEGRASGHIMGGSGFEQQTMEKFHVIRAQYGAIGDELQGRMPLAYAHIVQVLVDLILWLYPIMGLSAGMSPFLVVVGTGLLTTSYQGLFDLAKQFLDPYDNENYGSGEDPLSVDTLIAETNAGSVRWMNAFEEMPFSAQKLRDGELYDYLLPVRGYSVEELAQMEEDKIQREKELEEQRLREEAEEAERKRQLEENRLLNEQDDDDDDDDEESKAEDVDEGKGAADVKGVHVLDSDIEGASMTSNLTEASTSNETTSKRARNETLLADEEAEIIDDEDILLPETVNQTEKIVTSKEAMKGGSVNDTKIEDARVVHKVTTLASGMPVTFKTNYDNDEVDAKVKQADDEEESLASLLSAKRERAGRVPPIPQAVSEYLSTLSRQEEGTKRKRKKKDDIDDYSSTPDTIDYDMLGGLPWYDLVGPDGQEIRLSQMMADEEWDEEQNNVVESLALTYEEFTKRANEIREAKENEMLETAEIMSAVPGAEKLIESKGAGKQWPPKYDQTRLDGISQLWGLPPEDPDAFVAAQQLDTVDDAEFSGISQLWGQPMRDSRDRRGEDVELVGMASFSGVSELWGDTIDGAEDDTDGAPPTNSGKSDRQAVDRDDGDDVGNDDIMSSSKAMGVPWHNEYGSDGKEYRLSEMLADEIFQEPPEPVEMAPITLDEYKEQVSEILTAAEEELLETEAIMKTAPGLDPIGWDQEDSKPVSVANSTLFEEEDLPDIESRATEENDLDVLEMDIDDDDTTFQATNETDVPELADPSMDEGPVDGIKSEYTEHSSDIADSTSAVDERTEEGSVSESATGEDDDIGLNGKHLQLEQLVADDEINDEGRAQLPEDTQNINEDSTLDQEGAERPESKKGSDIIEPIMLEPTNQTEAKSDEDLDPVDGEDALQ